MYLKRVELAGFKSFADRTGFEFVPGITAVVGPNGSGKSNITDAIRWVLGEQSAKSLRGAKMEDIIFAGSDSRKPVNFSEVSLTLDNSDQSLDLEYTEVTVTRRLFRSGESDYFINKQSCRLKDITELFMDTGLGKEAYSIIGQGKIEEILSSKAEDRRGVFEEAAGIVKYKVRKKEAKKKLEETEQNLLRIYDLISELEGQVEPLEEQARVAKEYRGYAKQLKDLNVQIYVHDIDKAHKEWLETDQHKKELSTEQLELSSQINQVDALIEEKRWSVSQMEKELDELHKQLINISERVEQAEGKKEVLKEREKNNQLNKSQVLQSIEKMLTKKSETTIQLRVEKEKLEEIESKIENLSQRLLNEENSLTKLLIDHESLIESYKEEYFECLNEMATLRNETRHISNFKDSTVYRIDKLRSELELAEKEEASIAIKKENIEKEILNLHKDIEVLGKEYDANQHSERELVNKYELIQTEIRQQQQKLNSILSRQEVLKEMQADFSGFNQGVKEILKLRETKRLNGIHGAVAELIKVPKKYETAIEIALGNALQNIVVDTENIARQAIRHLKENRLGRATFLPIETINSRFLNKYELEKIQNIEGYIGVASELIEVDQAYSSIIKSLLGQVIVTSNLKEANEISNILRYSKRIVTLEGDVVNPGGSMTGGSLHKKSANLLGRQREIDELSILIGKLKQTISEDNKKFTNIEISLRQIREEKENSRIKIEQNKIKEQELHGKKQQIQYEIKTLDERLSVINQEIQQLTSELNDLIIKEQGIINDLEAKENKEQELQQNIAQAESIRKQDESTKEQMNQTIIDIKIDLARLNQEKNGSVALVERLISEFNEIVDSIEQYQQTLLQLENDTTNQIRDKEDISQGIDQLRREKELLQKNIDEKRLHRSRNIQEIESEEIGSKETRKNLKIIESGLHKCDVKLSRLDVELENLLKQLAEEYEMSFEWAKQKVEMIENINNAKEEVKSLKQKIHRLGEVNLGAIEEYQRVSERYDFLSTQKEDLVEAKDTLYQVIQEVDEEMARRFKESFDAIREQFQLVFMRLFGGGQADLILTDLDDMLDTGIEIIAQPPGKKLQNLALLSGGEKALTAITLLFAILRVRPVPFCVLDEVEAALDEANVTRFIEYLREFSEDTQFIVVTHRKGTMEGADVLYGVTMQESGVSRLVSVKLEKSEKVLQTV